MCGRFTLFKLDQLAAEFPEVGIPDPPPPPRYNIAPTQPILAATNRDPSHWTPIHWGLIPSWAKDQSIGSRMINARCETAAEKPAFRSALRRRRCIVPADGFYEWRTDPGGKTKTPMYIRRKDGRLMVFAGLWEVWHDPTGGEIPSCTLLTGRPNELVGAFHDRMVVMLPEDRRKAWLAAEERRGDDLLPLLEPIDAAELEAYPVSRAVNRPANNSPDLVQPASLETLF